MKRYRTHILLCYGGACISSGAETVRERLAAALPEAGLADEVDVITTGCMGACELGPLMVIYPDGVFYQKVQPDDVGEIVSEHLLKGRVVSRLFYRPPAGEEVVARFNDIDFFKLQKKIALRNCGYINPLEIDDYIAADGYLALGRALTEMAPADIVAAVKESGLRGRGGAGFPTGLKWELTARAAGGRKFVCCNADEGDPGAFMDRSILEGDPHSVIEAMAICGRAIGASAGFVYVRAEYPLAVERLENAIVQARQYGLLGKNILGSGFDFDLEIRMGAGAFVCGEETALMHSIEGRRGEPRIKPPFPAEKGLFGCPTVLNNVETFANIPAIITRGPADFAAVGTEKSRGTKVFALAGDINNTGLIEVPIGIPLGTIIYDIGGGVPRGKKLKAVQIGGPSGGCLPVSCLNTPVDYESLQSLGAIMGSGGLVVMNEDTCMVDLARYFMEFIQEESCGKCTPCRQGTRVMLDILTRICAGGGRLEDIDHLEELAARIKDTSLCGLGQTAPNPVLSTLRYFRHEYVEHIRHHHCRAGVCAEMIWAPCTNACPASVNVPAYLACVGEGNYEEALREHLLANPLPAVCGRVCPQWCIDKCRRDDLEGPLAIRLVKRFMADHATSEKEIDAFYPPREADNGIRVAIVGSGPSGLTAAYFLALLGYRPTVFEAAAKPGGMLRYAIPDYRLPRAVLDREIKGIESLGVTIRTGVEVGRDVTIPRLREEGFRAFYLATGCWREIMPGVPGEKQPGVYAGLDFLGRVARGESPAVGRQVMIIGGGDCAIDCSRVAQRLGAREVTILYRRTRGEMPTNPIEIAEAEVEGVRVEFLVNITAITRRDQRLAVNLRRMRLGEFDGSGRRRPVEISTSDEERLVDTVILAVGQRADVARLLEPVPELAGQGDRLAVDSWTGQTAAADIFAGGDLASGPATVVEAIGSAQKAVRSIDRLLCPGRGDYRYHWERLESPAVPVDLEREIESRDPSRAELLRPEERLISVEVEKTISVADACREAKRCLRCEYRHTSPEPAG